jgi:iron complex transport system substrate-binding protein
MKKHDSWALCLGILFLMGISALAGQRGFSLKADFERAAVEKTPLAAEVVAGKPVRIVSTDYRADETLLALVSPDRIAALSRDADNPNLCNAIEAARAVAGRTDTDPERILALRPDLVVAADGLKPETAALLRESGVRIFQLNRAYSVEEIRRNVVELGGAVGEPERAASVAAEYDAALDTLRRLTAGSRPCRTLYVGGGRTYTAGSGTYTDALIRAAGGLNVAAEAGVKEWGPLSIERAVALDPEVIFVPDGTEGHSPHAVVQTPVLANDPAWRDVRAVREGRVFLMPNRLLMCASHLNVRTGLAMARALHPEAFSNESFPAIAETGVSR